MRRDSIRLSFNFSKQGVSGLPEFITHEIYLLPRTYPDGLAAQNILLQDLPIDLLSTNNFAEKREDQLGIVGFRGNRGQVIEMNQGENRLIKGFNPIFVIIQEILDPKETGICVLYRDGDTSLLIAKQLISPA